MVKQVDDIFIAHADAAMRRRLAEKVCAMRTVDIDIAGQGIHPATAVDAGLASLQPQDAGKDPVLLRIVVRGIKYPDRLACNKNRVYGKVFADLGSDAMPAKRCLQAVSYIATAFFGC